MDGHAPVSAAARLLYSAIIGYCAGCFSSADVAARTATAGAIDLRRAGSGNPGGANAAKVLGKRWGYAVMLADIAKAFAAARVGGRLAGGAGAHTAAVAAVVGHCHPVWNPRHGGKGVACSVGQCLATFPAYFPADLAVAAITAGGPWRARPQLVTGVASAAWIAAAVVWWRAALPNAWGPKATVGLPIAAAASSTVIMRRFAQAANRQNVG
jgi:glycerol-3-phosphate acyltransferase PlsY